MQRYNSVEVEVPAEQLYSFTHLLNFNGYKRTPRNSKLDMRTRARLVVRPKVKTYTPVQWYSPTNFLTTEEFIDLFL